MNLILPNKLVDKTNNIDCATHSRVGRGLGGRLRRVGDNVPPERIYQKLQDLSRRVSIRGGGIPVGDIVAAAIHKACLRDAVALCLTCPGLKSGVSENTVPPARTYQS